MYNTLFDMCMKAKRPEVALGLWQGFLVLIKAILIYLHIELTDFKENVTYMKGISTIRTFHLALGKLTKSVS